MLSIVCAPFISFGFSTTKNSTTITISSTDIIKYDMIKLFLEDLKILEKKVIFTTGTPSSLEKDPVSKYWIPHDTKIKNLLFGGNGSPMKQNEKMLILCDSYRLHNAGKNSIYNKDRFEEILSEVLEIINVFGTEIKIALKSKTNAEFVRKALASKGIKVAFGDTNDPSCVEITWYGATDSIGVHSDRRIMILIGFAYKNVNRFDSLTQGSKDASDIKSHLDNQASFYQLLSRVKDPDAKENSLVFALGITYNECVNGTTLGDKYIEKIGPNTNDIRVTCSQYIDGPNILKCTSFKDMLTDAADHMGVDLTDKHFKLLNEINCSQSCFEEKIPGFKIENPLKENYKRTFDLKTWSEISVVQFLHMISTEKTFSSLKCLKDVMRHRHNKKVLKTCQVTSKGEAKWLRFGDMNEFNKNRLISFFNCTPIQYKVEKVYNKGKDRSYNVWVFLIPVNAKKAKRFGEYIIEFLSFDKAFINGKETKFECTLLPEFVDVNTRKDHEIKMPLHNTSFLLVNGEYTNKFDTMEGIELFDLTNVDVESFGKNVAAIKDRSNRAIYMREYMSKRSKTSKNELMEDDLLEQAEWQRIVEASKMRLLLSTTEEQLNDWWDGVTVSPKYMTLHELYTAC